MVRARRPDTSAMDDQHAKLGGHPSVAAGLILGYWLADGYVIGLPVAVLAATWNPGLVFLAGVAVVIAINLVACRWINTAWSAWANGASGARMERRLDKLRGTPVGGATTPWVGGGPDARVAPPAPPPRPIRP